MQILHSSLCYSNIEYIKKSLDVIQGIFLCIEERNYLIMQLELFELVVLQQAFVLI